MELPNFLKNRRDSHVSNAVKVEGPCDTTVAI